MSQFGPLMYRTPFINKAWPAREFAAQGATVFLSGRTLTPVAQVAHEIQREGGIAYAAQVDALDEQAVQAYLARVVQEGGEVSISS